MCDQNNQRILVIDDNTAIHEDFRKILASEINDNPILDTEMMLFGPTVASDSTIEFQVDFASQGEEGLDRVVQACESGNPYALAFVDMRMPPGWDGVETIQRIWQVDPQIQIVICTAYSDYDWFDIVEQLGRTDRLLILRKPFDSIEVSQMASALSEKWILTQATEAELRDKDEQLQRKQRLESIGSLAGGVAHEFNNLLQAIQGYTSFAQDTLTPESDAFQDLDKALIATKRAAAITSQLLNFSRKGTEAKSTLIYNELVQQALDLLRPLLSETIEMDVCFGEDVGAVFGDATMLQQIVTNLCINARDAMPDGGTLSISTGVTMVERNQIDSLKPGRYATMLVKDTGMGMSPDIVRRIFDPFFTTKEVGKGTGLGLATVYGVVTQHDGHIDVQSQPGLGTAFKVYLPMCETPANTENHRTTTRNAIHRDGLILLAEDERVVRDVAVRILQRAGYRTIAAKDGHEAVESFLKQADEIDLVMLDIVMPRMTGREAFEKIRASRPETKVVFCTGYDPETAHTGSLETQGLAVVGKPFEAEHLLETIRNVLAEDEYQISATEIGDNHV